jgi:hypothetical protein
MWIFQMAGSGAPLVDRGPATPLGAIRLPVPAYLPSAARTVLPWARRYVTTTSRHHALALADCWDEALTALVRRLFIGGILRG